MARYKSDNGKIESLEEVDLTLKEIGIAEQQLAAIDAKCNEAIAKLKEKALKDGESLRNSINAKVEKIQSFAEYNKNELFKDAKSIELNFGKIGYRKSTKISVKKTTLELLKKILAGKKLLIQETQEEEKKNLLVEMATRIEACIRVKEEVNKEALGLMDDSFLPEVGACRKVTNDFFCEATPEEVNKDLLKAGA